MSGWNCSTRRQGNSVAENTKNRYLHSLNILGFCKISNGKGAIVFLNNLIRLMLYSKNNIKTMNENRTRKILTRSTPKL